MRTLATLWRTAGVSASARNVQRPRMASGSSRRLTKPGRPSPHQSGSAARPKRFPGPGHRFPRLATRTLTTSPRVDCLTCTVSASERAPRREPVLPRDVSPLTPDSGAGLCHVSESAMRPLWPRYAPSQCGKAGGAGYPGAAIRCTPNVAHQGVSARSYKKETGAETHFFGG
jgi:hypothetical protein